VGRGYDKPSRRRRASPRRPRPRICLRKGCGRQYQPRRWNQRYCQDAECLRLVRRWLAARRQARRRQDDAAKTQHAEAQRARRRRVTSLPQAAKDREVAAARGHAAKILLPPLPTPLCDRPGCHEAPVKSGRNQARYCCPSCRQALRRVLDRERKWRVRGTFQGRRARDREYSAARARRRAEHRDTTRGPPPRPSPP
jgi:hypothetical protein